MTHRTADQHRPPSPTPRECGKPTMEGPCTRWAGHRFGCYATCPACLSGDCHWSTADRREHARMTGEQCPCRKHKGSQHAARLDGLAVWTRALDVIAMNDARGVIA